MGKPTGFVEYLRESPPERDALERVGDWREVYLPLPEVVLRRQGARCMDCGVPFCHTGALIAGMAVGCPLGNLIPEWNDLVYKGLWREAYARLDATNSFPEFTGRVCPAPCESACVLGIHEPAVTIKSLEQAIVDRAFHEGWVTPAVPPRRTDRKVAIIGSGPAGLACADQLNKAGHSVTVFERADKVGGLLVYGIPGPKLDKSLVTRRVALMEASGVAFRTSVEIGRDVSIAALRADFHAIVYCGGATKARDIDLPGRELAGIHLAMEYLTASAKGLPSPTAKDKDVVVLGGGDTGTDCVATALRQGCKSLIQLEIQPRPPDERAEGNPWPEWPRIFRVDYGQKEAKAVFGHDPRTFGVRTTRFEGDGAVSALRTVDIVGDTLGREREWPAQLVLLAMGFLGPEDAVPDALGLARDARSNVQADARYQTSVEGVFTAGDARRGQSLVVWAIAEGRAAARECDRWLMGSTALP